MEAPEPVELQIIKIQYEKALECLNAGILEDSMGNKDRAIALYRLGRCHLLQGLEMASEQNSQTQQVPVKMNEILRSICTRLSALESTSATGPSSSQNCCPVLMPSMGTASIHTDRMLASVPLGGAPCLPLSPAMASDVPWDLPPAYTPQPTDENILQNRDKRITCPSLPIPELVSHHQDVLFCLPHGVQIFFVTPDGQVSAPSYPGYLRITLNSNQHYDSDDTNDTRHPLAYLQVCDWNYPLFPDLPVLLSNSGVFTFPDTMAAVPGSCVGILLSSELPEVDRALFQEHLSSFTQLRVQSADDDGEGEATGRDMNLNTKTLINPADDTALGKEEKILPGWSEKMSQSITAGASWLSRGLVQGAEATGKAIHNGAVKLREHLTPEETPVEVSPRVTTGLRVAQQATGGAVKVSKFLVDGLSTVVGLVGKEIAPHIKKHSSKLIPESLKSNKDACTNMTGAKVVAASSLKGLSTIWSSLETAAKTIGKSASSETVQTVKHKYGDQASQAADAAFQSVTSVGVTAFTLDKLGLKVVLKCASKQTSNTLTAEDQTMNPEERAKGEKCLGPALNMHWLVQPQWLGTCTKSACLWTKPEHPEETRAP
ncbi:spartin a isoform X2 [Neoarius graeffei]|uniref:spartin a isoform X2 n=1 Tax=Neoarius graeffei TaxID=443677 RepID=UPI00298C5B5F|nr:spartin a isoform X2 [Neoarius graeffei]